VTIADKFSLRALYLYSVCLVTLLISLFSLVGLVRGTVSLLYPDPYNGYVYAPPALEGTGVVEKEAASRERDLARRSQVRNEVLGLVGSATTAAVAVPVYIYHWRRVQRDRRDD
jgi:hypothetical protein